VVREARVAASSTAPLPAASEKRAGRGAGAGAGRGAAGSGAGRKVCREASSRALNETGNAAVGEARRQAVMFHEARLQIAMPKGAVSFMFTVRREDRGSAAVHTARLQIVVSHAAGR